ncbi:hypothetical protein [Hyphococcus sp. DH-69]|uniref:hypothetical protein n=1 Tax=Hyphococcus formosus TaxID=3143534 RepID=UPI00398BB062
MLGTFLILLGLLALGVGLYWYWRRKVAAEIAEGAAYEWAFYQKNEPEFVADLTEDQFNEIYRRVNEPRFPGYALAAVATFLVSLPLTLGLLGFSQWVGQKLGILPQPVEIVRYVNLGEVKVAQSWQCGPECQLYVAEAFSGFYFFFGIVIVWLVIVWFFMRRFHNRRPGYLRDEILRAKS